MTTSSLSPTWPVDAAYQPRSSWRGITAFLATVAIFGVSAGVGVVVALALEQMTGLPWFGVPPDIDRAMEEGPYGFFLVTQIGLQASVVVLTMWLAGRYAASSFQALSLTPARGGAMAYVKGMAVVLLVGCLYSTVLFIVTPETVAQDIKPYMGMATSDAAWLLAFIVAVGAPLSEELLFRGFLLSALAQTPLGFVGASVITTALWAALHAQYSVAGLIAVFLLGLTFCWLLWRTGSLWVPIVCHGIYNALVLALVWAMATGLVVI
ncbi:MAG: CPBP family intramembrane glutamic endopeptidase [Pseudomonadota bacterium]